MGSKTEFQTFLDEEVNKVKGIYYPVKAGMLQRLFVRKAPCDRLHPNPNDEFCIPEIGPNYSIISNYEKEYRALGNNMSDAKYRGGGIAEPLMVEKTRPDGFLILNGHHRWAAARRAGVSRLKIQIVNLTQENDIRKMLKATSSNKRLSLDLDEVVFCAPEDPNVERGLMFPLNKYYKERLRLGIPALFHTLSNQGYDIWIYSARYYSLDYLQHFFRHYRVPVTGIVTGTARKTAPGAETVKKMENLLSTKYQSTVHIDNDMILCTSKDRKEFEEYRLSGSSASWSREVMEILGKKHKQEEKKGE